MSIALSINYSYLADGTKLTASDKDGNGYVYMGSLVYRREDARVPAIKLDLDDAGISTLGLEDFPIVRYYYDLESTPFDGGRLTVTQAGGSNTYTPKYYSTDHLGSVRTVIDGGSGETVEKNDYDPFGSRIVDAQNEISDNRYRYNGKEEQAFVGVPYTDYGARMYDPKIAMRWNRPDPLAEKYSHISPYAFCANNPINFVDPDGREIWLQYMDNDNNIVERLRYSAGMEYKGSNSFISSSISYLNNIYSFGGSKAIDLLSNSSNIFDITNELPSGNGTFAFKENQAGGGTLRMGALSGLETLQNIEGIAHELFHGVQHELGQGGTSIFNEVEAYVFGAVIANKFMIASDDFQGYTYPLAGMGQSNAQGMAYEEAFASLMTQFSKQTFVNAVNNFKTGAQKNQTGLYNTYPILRKTNKIYVLPRFLTY